MHHGFAFDMQAVCTRLRLRADDGRPLYPRRHGQARAGDRRRDLLAHPRLERPHHLRAVRRRRRRAGAGGAARAAARSPTAACWRRSLRSDGAHKDKLYVDGGPSTTGTVGHLRMEGREVFKHAVGMITDVIEATFAAGRHHRRRPRLVRAAPGQQAHHRRLGQEARHRRAKRWSSPSTCTATPRPPRFRWRLPLAVADGRIKKGDLVLLEAMGGGFTWGAVLLRW